MSLSDSETTAARVANHHTALIPVRRHPGSAGTAKALFIGPMPQATVERIDKIRLETLNTLLESGLAWKNAKGELCLRGVPEIRQQIIETIFLQPPQGPSKAWALPRLLWLAIHGHDGPSVPQRVLSPVQNDIATMFLLGRIVLLATNDNFNNPKAITISVETLEKLERLARVHRVSVVFTKYLSWGNRLPPSIEAGAFNNVAELGLALSKLDVTRLENFKLHETMPNLHTLTMWGMLEPQHWLVPLPPSLVHLNIDVTRVWGGAQDIRWNPELDSDQRQYMRLPPFAGMETAMKTVWVNVHMLERRQFLPWTAIKDLRISVEIFEALPNPSRGDIFHDIHPSSYATGTSRAELAGLGMPLEAWPEETPFTYWEERTSKRHHAHGGPANEGVKALGAMRLTNGHGCANKIYCLCAHLDMVLELFGAGGDSHCCLETCRAVQKVELQMDAEAMKDLNVTEMVTKLAKLRWPSQSKMEQSRPELNICGEIASHLQGKVARAVLSLMTEEVQRGLFSGEVRHEVARLISEHIVVKVNGE